MAINNIPSNLSNLVAPFLPSGQRPVGQEFAENRNSTFKPVEQMAKTAEGRVQLRYRQDDEDRETGQQPRQEGEEERDDEVEGMEREPPEDTPGSRLARRFSGSTGSSSRTGRNFDELV